MNGLTKLYKIGAAGVGENEEVSWWPTSILLNAYPNFTKRNHCPADVENSACNTGIKHVWLF